MFQRNLFIELLCVTTFKHITLISTYNIRDYCGGVGPQYDIVHYDTVRSCRWAPTF